MWIATPPWINMDPCKACVVLKNIKGGARNLQHKLHHPLISSNHPVPGDIITTQWGCLSCSHILQCPCQGAKTEATFVKQCCLIVLFSHPTQTRCHHKAQGGPMVHCKRIFTHLIFRPLFPHFTYYLLFMIYILNKETINNYSACLWVVIKGAFVFLLFFCWQPVSFAVFPMMA